MNTRNLVRTVGLLLVAILVLPFLGGCATTQPTIVDEAVIGADAATKSASTLLLSGLITKEEAKTFVLVDVPVVAAANAYITASASNDTTGMTTASAAVQSALTAVSQELATISQNPKVSAIRRHTATLQLARLKVNQATLASGKQGVGEVAAIIAIVQIVAEITPPLTQWINNAINAKNVTPAQLATDVAALQGDLATLQTGISTATTLSGQ